MKRSEYLGKMAVSLTDLNKCCDDILFQISKASALNPTDPQIAPIMAKASIATFGLKAIFEEADLALFGNVEELAA